MKMNIAVRLKNPWFWIGLLGVVLTAMGLDAQMLTSWEAVGKAALELVGNPYLLGSVAVAVLGVFIDPTTAGVGDSAQALKYKEPRKDVDLTDMGMQELRKLALDLGMMPDVVHSRTRTELMELIREVTGFDTTRS